MHPYDIVEAFEARVAEYAGARYGVAVNSCTSALMLAAAVRKKQGFDGVCEVPDRTYVGVYQALWAAGVFTKPVSRGWSGAYRINPADIVDSARRFNRGMYSPDTLYCLSFHWGKHLKIGRGGMVLTDNAEERAMLRAMRYDGRTPGVPPKEDCFLQPAWHVYMIPEDAARGLMLMEHMPDDNDDLPNDEYPDLSQAGIWRQK